MWGNCDGKYRRFWRAVGYGAGSTPAKHVESGGGEHRRDLDRVVRLLPLRDHGRARLREALLPEVGSAHGYVEHVRDLLRRFSRPTGRRLALRHLRRPHRSQSDADRNPPVDGYRDLRDRRHADLLEHWSLGGGGPGHSAALPG